MKIFSYKNQERMQFKGGRFVLLNFKAYGVILSGMCAK